MATMMCSALQGASTLTWQDVSFSCSTATLAVAAGLGHYSVWIREDYSRKTLEGRRNFQKRLAGFAGMVVTKGTWDLYNGRFVQGTMDYVSVGLLGATLVRTHWWDRQLAQKPEKDEVV